MIDSGRYGVSFSVKQCRNFGLDPHATLAWLLRQGWRRFRLMSYWDEHEKQAGTYDFAALDWQVGMVADAGGTVSLCLGAKQPRWPEYHWPDWAWQAAKPVRDKALLRYVELTVQRYSPLPAIVSWQLENEALLSNFGNRIDIDRARLRQEYKLVKRLDPSRPIAMSTSNGWGIPLRHPRPDLVGFSFYPIMYKDGRYHATIQKPWVHRLCRALIPQPVFMHELQCEPWGPRNIWDMNLAEQAESMSLPQLQQNIAAAGRIGAYPIDIWGAEWWYWRHLQGDDTVNDAILSTI